MDKSRAVQNANGGTMYPNSRGGIRGRKKGVPNKITRLLKETTMEALEEVGYPVPEMIHELDKKGKRTGRMVPSGKTIDGKGGLKGYIKYMAHTDLKAMSSLLGRILPMQVNMKASLAIDEVMRSAEEVQAELRQRGIPQALIPQQFTPPADMEIEGTFEVMPPSDHE